MPEGKLDLLYAIISDIHGNLHALEAVLENIKMDNADRVICLGDLVGYGAYPNEVISLTREISDVILAGNHDHAAVGLTDITIFNQYAFNAAVWTRDKLSDDNTRFLKQIPFTHSESDLIFAHATPIYPEKWLYVFSNTDAADVMEQTEYGTAFIGHSHVPFDYRTRYGRLINVGSVGQPRDGDPRAAYCLYDSDSGEARLYRVEYDKVAAGDAIRDAGLPEFLADRLSMGR